MTPHNSLQLPCRPHAGRLLKTGACLESVRLRTEADVECAASRSASCTRGLALTGHQASATSTLRVTSTLQRSAAASVVNSASVTPQQPCSAAVPSRPALGKAVYQM